MPLCARNCNREGGVGDRVSVRIRDRVSVKVRVKVKLGVKVSRVVVKIKAKVRIGEVGQRDDALNTRSSTADPPAPDRKTERHKTKMALRPQPHRRRRRCTLTSHSLHHAGL